MTKEEWLAIRQQLPDDTRIQWTQLLYIVDLCVLVAAWLIWLKAPVWIRPGALILAAIATIQIYLILHEAAHGSVSNKRRINDLVGHLCGWMIFLPFLPRRRYHMAHHAWTAHPLRDPENKNMIEKLSVMTEKQGRTLEFMWRHWIPMIAANHFIGNWRAPYQARAKGNHSPQIKKEIRFTYIYLAGYIAVAGLALTFHAGWQLFCFYFPVWISLLIMVEVLNLPHHAEAPLQAEDDDRLFFWDQESVSHDCGTLPIWSRFIILNFNLHIVHHAFPRVPWYHLSRARDLLAQQRDSVGPEPMDEWRYALKNRRRPLLTLMGHFFDRRSSSKTRPAEESQTTF
ncbi:fatty acid desaturase family protein [Paraherbaspirillum soli]|uniref:Fatty acid desaturase family protein n=1 Tax=Paraherbaspirillum soli TaxID=631222 RepID=A0ABW0MBD6_9BURK